MVAIGVLLSASSTVSAGVAQEQPGRTVQVAASPVLLGACGGTYPGTVRPGSWDAGCTGVADLSQMQWQAWGGPVATGTGATQLNDCSPSCAEGHVETYPVTASLFRIRSCRDSRGRVGRFYTRVRLLYDLPADNPFGQPAGRQDGTYNQVCRSPASFFSCGPAQPDGPGDTFETAALRMSCGRAKRLASRAGRITCRKGCTTRKTIRVRGYRCRYGPFNRQHFYMPVRCTKGQLAVRFRVAID